jgi:hypothetical protein
MAYDVDKGQPLVSVRSVEQIVKRVKEREEERKELEAQVAKYEHKKCPKCKKDPVSKDYRGFPWVRCENFHSWSLKTGMTEELERRPEPKEPKKEFPDYIRTTYTVLDFARALNNLVKADLTELKEIRKVDVSGVDKDGKEISIGAEMQPDSVNFWMQKGKSYEEIHVEKKEYEKEDLKDFRTVVRTFPPIESVKDARKLEERVEQLFKEFGGVERPKRRKQPRGGAEA